MCALEYAATGCSTSAPPDPTNIAQAQLATDASGEASVADAPVGDSNLGEASVADAPVCTTCEQTTALPPQGLRAAPFELLPLDKKGTKLCPIPAGCTTIKGGTYGAEWLQCHREDQGGIENGLFYCSSYILGGCGYSLSGTQQQAIADMCKTLPTDQAKYECIAAALQTQMADAGNVCRNYGVCMYKIANLAGITSGFNHSSTHVWNEFTVPSPDGCGTQTLIIDSYNGIEFMCPNGSCTDGGGRDAAAGGG